ncbi:C1 family peptidase [Nocardia sp. NPDC057030]|uniref:C1 family peptidase n=1 Tax=unclassified Nocardia TaxID=2637762 RepID=UPI003630DCA9
MSFVRARIAAFTDTRAYHSIIVARTGPGARSTAVAIFAAAIAAVSGVQPASAAPPISVDWREEGKVAPVRTQGADCEDSWGFATAATLESAVAIKSGSLPNYVYVYDQAKAKSGSRTPKCDAYQKEAPAAGTVQRWEQIRQGDEAALQSTVAAGPTRATMHLGEQAQRYRGGIFEGPCAGSPNSAVVVVGYSDSYWIVRNSWGAGWGEQGYMRLARGSNLCGIADDASRPVVNE